MFAEAAQGEAADYLQVSPAVYDLDRSPKSRALVERFTASGYFSVTVRPDSPGTRDGLLDKGEVATTTCPA